MIDKVIKYNYCTGCGLCQSIFGKDKVSVGLTEAGFYRPTINSKLDVDILDKFSNVCPGISVKKDRIDTPITDPIWGEMFSCFIGTSTDDKIRDQASSGGAITSILTYLLDSNSVDAIIHIGVSKDCPYENEVKISTTRKEVIEHANSRYSPSAPLIDILQQLNAYERYAFVGKPCDVAGLKQLSKYNDVVKDKIKYYIAFFCAGTPSLNATKNILETMDINRNDVVSLSYRKDGWPGYFKVVDKNNNTHKLSYSLTWMSLLGPTIQFRCKICSDGIGHLADVVCADAWEDFDHKGFPTFRNAPGRSLIISRTLVGELLIKDAVSGNYIDEVRNIENYREIDKMQPGQLAKKVNFLSRVLAVYIKNGVIPKFNRDFYFKATYRQSLLSFIKNFTGTLKRLK